MGRNWSSFHIFRSLVSIFLYKHIPNVRMDIGPTLIPVLLFILVVHLLTVWSYSTTPPFPPILILQQLPPLQSTLFSPANWNPFFVRPLQPLIQSFLPQLTQLFSPCELQSVPKLRHYLPWLTSLAILFLPCSLNTSTRDDSISRADCPVYDKD